MLNALMQLSFFTAKAVIIVALILILLVGVLALFSRGKDKLRGRIAIKNLNKKYSDIKATLLEEILSKKAFKKFLKASSSDKKENNLPNNKLAKKNVFVLNFNGDIKASAVSALREEVTAILGVATSNDEVVLCLESAGGMVHAYGLATAQLIRIREKNINLTVCVDKVAASGGYLMAAVANEILAAPFAIIGSIGVIVQLPNFNRLLKEKNIDFEQITAGNFKRTLTMFGENTEEGREKLHQEIEGIHQIFKNLVKEYRQQCDIEKISTGEHWLAKQAIELKLVDKLVTSDDYLLSKSKEANLYEITYQIKKSFGEKIFSNVRALKESVLDEPYLRV